MTKDEVREALAAGELIHLHSWVFSQGCMSCDSEDNCCYEAFNSVEEAMNEIPSYGEWSDCSIL